MSIYKVMSCVVEKGCLLWSVHSFGRILLAFALLHFVLQGQTCLLFQVSLDSLLLHSNPLWWIGHLLGALFLGGHLGLHRVDQLQLLQHWCLWHRLGLLWCWMVCPGNERDHSVIFKVVSKYCILDSFVDNEGYSISSMGFLPTIVVIMVVWIKFTPSHPFYFIDS